VIHGDQDTGYRPLSEAMVNIRATLEHARAEAVLTPATCAALVTMAKQTFYPDRSYSSLLARAAETGLPAAELAALREFLPTGRRDQKREDALSMLRAMRDHMQSEPGPKRVDYPFAHTDAWEQLVNQVNRRHKRAQVSDDQLLDELQIAGRLPALRRAALTRALALDEARRQSVVVNPPMLEQAVAAFSREHRLTGTPQLERWLREQRMDYETLAELLSEQASIHWVETMFQPDLIKHLVNHLRMTGAYGALFRRAQDKHRLLSARGLEEPGLEDAGIDEDHLWRWYFETCVARPRPDDIERYAQDAGYQNRAELRRSALREYLFDSLSAGSTTSMEPRRQ
jgi:hypothetical protein